MKQQKNNNEDGFLSFDPEELKNASRHHELTEDEIKGHFRECPTTGKERTPKKQSVKFSFDEVAAFFPDMKPREVRNKIMEILLAWYEAQKNDRQNTDMGGIECT